jgi:hypothetical protein
MSKTKKKDVPVPFIDEEHHKASKRVTYYWRMLSSNGTPLYSREDPVGGEPLKDSKTCMEEAKLAGLVVRFKMCDQQKEKRVSVDATSSLKIEIDLGLSFCSTYHTYSEMRASINEHVDMIICGQALNQARGEQNLSCQAAPYGPKASVR